MSLAFREEELWAADEIADEENKNIIKSVVDPTPGLLVNDEIDFPDINFLPNTIDNKYKLPPKVEKQLDEMVIDAIPKIEQDLYIHDDLNSFMFADYDSENNSDSMVIDVKPKNEQVKRKVDSDVEDETKKIHISPPEDYVDIEKLNRTVIEISSDSEDEVTYTKTTPSHPRDRLTVKIKEQEKQAIVVGDNDDEMYCKQKG